jgi:hypothetical protein
MKLLPPAYQSGGSGAAIPTNSFGSAQVEEITPLVQLKFDLGQTDEVEIFEENQGEVTLFDSLIQADSGAAAGSSATVASIRSVTYRAGVGFEWKGTLYIEDPADGNVCIGGLLGVTDSLGFGNNGLEFGAFRLHHGGCHIQDLTITAGTAASPEVATVTIDGDAYTVSLGANLTTEGVAYAVAESLGDQLAGWDFDSVGPTVVAINIFVRDPVLIGAFDYVGVDSAGAWIERQAGNDTETVFTPASKFSEMPGHEVSPGHLTPFKITGQYLGGGALKYYIEDTDTGNYDLVHIDRYAGTEKRTSVRSPSFRVGINSTNFTNATPVKMLTASMQGALQGKVVIDSPSKSDNATTTLVDTVPTNIITIKNRFEFADTRSLAEVLLGLVVASSDSGKPVDVRIIKNASFGAPVDYQYKDINSSLVLVATDKVSVDITSGEQIGGTTFLSTSSPINLRESNQFLAAGDTLTIAMNMTQGSASACSASLSWLEDK